jgi:hypothetical protein
MRSCGIAVVAIPSRFACVNAPFWLHAPASSLPGGEAVQQRARTAGLVRGVGSWIVSWTVAQAVAHVEMLWEPDWVALSHVTVELSAPLDPGQDVIDVIQARLPMRLAVTALALAVTAEERRACAARRGKPKLELPTVRVLAVVSETLAVRCLLIDVTETRDPQMRDTAPWAAADHVGKPKSQIDRWTGV